MQIATELTKFGVNRARSVCVGDRLEANLSSQQLGELSRALHVLRTSRTARDRLTFRDFIHFASNLHDLQIPIELVKASAGCGVLSWGDLLDLPF
jgi:hypothetical protein